MVTREDPTVCAKCGSKHLSQDEDVLDTWFSSALWPFSTLGWPDNTEDLKYFYPTSTLVTGYDIIFFWVARMIFSGLEQMGEVPFDTVLIHGLVRDELGRKMSKSLGNGVDPIEVINEYGADALRFNIITGNSPGNDMRYFPERCEAMRNFANKLWNASRFVMMNLSVEKNELPEVLSLEDKWILSKFNRLAKEVCDNIDSYELGVAAAKIYDFIWDDFCDWYIELTKTRLYGEDEAAKIGAQKVLLYVLTEMLKILHPFMPYITEEIFQALPHDGEAIMIQAYPTYKAELDFAAEEAQMEMVMDAIKAIRSRRAEMNVPPSKKAHVIVVTDKADTFTAGIPFIIKQAYASSVEVVAEVPANIDGMVGVVTNECKMYMPMAELVDIEKEKERINKELDKARKEVEGQTKKLQNEKFLAKAPEAVLIKERDRLARAEALIANLEESLKKLG